MYLIKNLEFWEQLVNDKAKYKNGFIVDLRKSFIKIVNKKFKNEYEILQDISLRTNEQNETFLIIRSKKTTFGFNIKCGGIDQSSVLDGWTSFQADGGIYFAIKPKTP